MANVNSTSVTKRAIEENIMAILDSSGVRDSRDLHDDRMSFLEAVRKTSLPDSTASTRRTYNAVFDIMRKDEGDLEVVMTCYQILVELEQWYPRISLAGGEVKEIIVNKEGWSPFIFSLDNFQLDGVCSQNSQDLLDSHGFSLLLQEVVQAFPEDTPSIKTLKEMLLFQYVVSVLENDFIPRQSVYKETLNWILMKESLLNTLLCYDCYRRLSFKGFIRDCISVIYKGRFVHDRILLCDEKNTGACDSSSLAFAFSEIEQKACLSVEKLLTMVMELDLIKKEADALGHTSRADGGRSPALDIILDELTYDTTLVSPFLQAFSEPKWKLEIILHYFGKYCSKRCLRTRNSDISEDTATLGSVLNYLSHPTNVKSINKRITGEVTRLLLAHAFQAYLYLHGEDSSALSEICRGTISVFENLRTVNRDTDMLPFEKEAIFTASTFLSVKTQITCSAVRFVGIEEVSPEG